jgi:hypothetical protein
MKKYILTLLIIAIILGCSKDNKEATNKIREALSTSLSNYDNADENNWVQITESEYNNIMDVVIGTSKQGASDVKMNSSTTNGWQADYTIGGNNDIAKIPTSSYIIALSVRTSIESTPSSSEGSKLKVSASQKADYEDYGSELPDIGNINPNTRVYFALKNPNSTTPSAPSYIAFYNAVLNFLGYNGINEAEEFYILGDNPNPNNSFLASSNLQIISTETKQW